MRTSTQHDTPALCEQLEPRLLLSAALPKLVMQRTPGSVANEGSTDAPGSLMFRVRRQGNAASLQTRSVAFVRTAVVDGLNAALAGSDFQAVQLRLIFKPRQKVQFFTVPLIGNDILDGDKIVTVEIFKAKKATIRVARTTGVIVNDDQPPPPQPPPQVNPKISISDVTATEGNSSTKDFTFNVTLDKASAQTITVQFATANGTATTADNDYQSTSGTLTFAPGETSKTIVVKVVGDTKVESNETFFVNLSNATNADIAKAQGTGTITNDDQPPPPPPEVKSKISISDVTATEGNSGTKDFTFNVTLDKVSAQTITVQFATANGTATTADNDYQPTSGTLTFTPGQTSKTIVVKVVGDTKVESNETFFVKLSNATNADIAKAQGTGTITNDDQPPPAPPDLTVQSSTVNVNFDQKIYQVQLSIRNNGAGNAAASKVRFELRFDGKPSVTLVTLDVPAINAGQTANLNYIIDPNPVFNQLDFPELWAVLLINDANNANNARFLDFVPTGENLNGFD
jgi:hypothetical protein